MQFKEANPIYVQIAERICDEILVGRYAADARVPSVREYSALLEVNVNTTVKSYDLLSARGILYIRRGMGYFVAPDAVELILAERRRQFRDEYLPDLFHRMRQLGVTMKDVEKAYGKEAE